MTRTRPKFLGAVQDAVAATPVACWLFPPASRKPSAESVASLAECRRAALRPEWRAILGQDRRKVPGSSCTRAGRSLGSARPIAVPTYTATFPPAINPGSFPSHTNCTPSGTLSGGSGDTVPAGSSENGRVDLAQTTLQPISSNASLHKASSTVSPSSTVPPIQPMPIKIPSC